MRLLIRLIISLCLLLRVGYAHADQGFIGNAPESLFDRPVQIHLSARKDGKVTVSKAPASNTGNKANDMIIATEMEEEEDDEPVSSKKHAGTRNGCIPFLYARTPEDYYRYLKNHLPFCEHFSRSSSFKFIIHRTIRI